MINAAADDDDDVALRHSPGAGGIHSLIYAGSGTRGAVGRVRLNHNRSILTWRCKKNNFYLIIRKGEEKKNITVT